VNDAQDATQPYDESSMDHGNSSNDHLLETCTQLAEVFDQAGEPTKAILMYRLVPGLSVRETASAWSRGRLSSGVGIFAAILESPY